MYLLSIQHQLKYAKISRANRLQSAQRMKLNLLLGIVQHRSQDILVINFMWFATRMESFILSIFRLQMSMMLITLMMLRKIFRIVC